MVSYRNNFKSSCIKNNYISDNISAKLPIKIEERSLDKRPDSSLKYVIFISFKLN